MPELLKKDKGIIFILTAVFCILVPFFYLKQGLLQIDTGREFYIPSQMLKNEVLYKDIYNIYGTLSYQINAFLFFIFGQEISVLYIAGLISSYIITITSYFISREFLRKDLSFLLTLLIMSALVFRTFLYNSVLTYSFAVVYALCAFLLSVLFLIKYTKTDLKVFAYLSCLFAGISITNKYEFILQVLIILITLCFIKPIGRMNFLKALAALISVPVLSFGSLLLQGFNFDDFQKTYILLKNLVNAPLLKLFFTHFGAFPSIKGLVALVYANKIYAAFGILPVLNIILFFIQIKEIYKNKPLFVFILCAISACAKNMFYLNVNHMGVFLFPICIITFVILLKKYFIKILPLILCACILFFICEDFNSLKYKNYQLETTKGSLYTYPKDGIPIKQTADYILKNTNAADRVVILPEGCFINFITDRNGDNFYYNLSPLFYKDVFKEENVILHFKNNMPEYFVILPIDNSEYGSRFFGIDYANSFYEMINNNYDLVENENGTEIFKRKNMK